MLDSIANDDLRTRAVDRAARSVVATVKRLQADGSARLPINGYSSSDGLFAEPAVSVAGTVAELLTDDPTIKDHEIANRLFCDYVFASSAEIQQTGLDIANLLEPVREARAILSEYRWLYEIVVQRISDDAEVTDAELRRFLCRGEADCAWQEFASLLPLLICTLLALILEHG